MDNRRRYSRLGQPAEGAPERRLPPGAFEIEGKVYIARDFYVYQVNFLAIAVGGSSTGLIAIQADSDFIWQKATAFTQRDDSGVVVAQPDANVQIIDSGSGRNLFEGPTPLFNVFGTGELPFILPTPRLFVARSTIEVQYTNAGAAPAQTLSSRLSFVGFKAFPLGV